MKESSIVLYQERVIDMSIGTASEVEFNFLDIWNYKKKLGWCFEPKALHFIHVHPSTVTHYSAKDVDCMKGFFLAFDSPIIFSIVIFDEQKNLFDTNSLIRIFEYDGKEIREITGESSWRGIWRPNNDQLLLLKTLSYGEFFTNGK